MKTEECRTRIVKPDRELEELEYTIDHEDKFEVVLRTNTSYRSRMKDLYFAYLAKKKELEKKLWICTHNLC